MSQTNNSVIDDLNRELIEAGLIADPNRSTTSASDEMDESIESYLATAEEISVEDAPIETEILEADGEIIEIDASAELPEELIEEAADAITAKEERQEGYNEQESTVEVVSTVEDASEPPVKAGKPRKVAGTGTPRASRLAGATIGAFAAAKLADDGIAAIVDALPAKVQQKAANLVEHMTGAKPLSVYTRVAVEMLKANGSLTGMDLVRALQDTSKKSGDGGYSIGTARSQAQQQTSLLKAFGIVAMVGGKLTLQADSAYWPRLAA